MGAQATREADGVLYTRAGLEIGVAATKTFTSQIAAMYLIALRLAELRGTLEPAALASTIAELKRLPHLIAELLERDGERIAEVARRYYEADFFLYLGRHIGLPVALEGALKLKEISYIATDAYAAGEMKHGPIALLDEHTPVVVVADRVAGAREGRLEHAGGAGSGRAGDRGRERGRRADRAARRRGDPRAADRLDAGADARRASRSSCSPTTSPGCAGSTSTSPETWPRRSRSSEPRARRRRSDGAPVDRHRSARDRAPRTRAGAPARGWPSGCSRR